MQATPITTESREPAPETRDAKPRARKLGRWGKRLGVAGFLFFLGKGLLWLIIPAWFLVERRCAGQ